MLHFIVPFLLAFGQPVIGHGGALNYTVDTLNSTTWYPGYSPYDGDWQVNASWLVQRPWVSINPIFETNNASLACNVPGTPANAYIPIHAGDNITAVYEYWVHTVGPMIAWLTDCNVDCSTVDVDKADWFKIGQEGLISGTILEGMWFQHAFGVWDGGPSLWPERIPPTLRPGKYLVRHEIIALHSANKPQFYPECANLEISGNGTSFPGKEYMAKIPGVWNMSMPEINIDVYSPAVANLTTYKIPGPPVWRG